MQNWTQSFTKVKIILHVCLHSNMYVTWGCVFLPIIFFRFSIWGLLCIMVSDHQMSLLIKDQISNLVKMFKLQKTLFLLTSRCQLLTKIVFKEMNLFSVTSPIVPVFSKLQSIKLQLLHVCFPMLLVFSFFLHNLTRIAYFILFLFWDHSQ